MSLAASALKNPLQAANMFDGADLIGIEPSLAQDMQRLNEHGESSQAAFQNEI